MDIKSMSLKELEEILKNMGEKAFHYVVLTLLSAPLD